MALKPVVLKCNLGCVCHLKPSFQRGEMQMMPQKVIQSNNNISRRGGTMAVISTFMLAREAIFGEEMANAFDFRLTTPEQTIEEAESGIRDHVRSLLQVKGLLESGYWGEAQKALRKSSAYLKQDIYTIIQSKPGSERPQLRKLYSNLFNNVTSLDYAARDKDAPLVWKCYENIVVALDDILSRI